MANFIPGCNQFNKGKRGEKGKDLQELEEGKWALPRANDESYFLIM